MVVNLKCKKCGKVYKVKVYSRRDAKSIKKDSKGNKFTCWKCIGVGGYGNTLGIISG